MTLSPCPLSLVAPTLPPNNESHAINQVRPRLLFENLIYQGLRLDFVLTQIKSYVIGRTHLCGYHHAVS